ncbi:hypothetical protein JHK84_045159 [Glycine max]|nr:hypothetical protein JHK84_045159 [Glycine max]
MRRFKETEDCFIVGFDPSAAAVPLLVDSSANDVSVIAEKGQSESIKTFKLLSLCLKQDMFIGSEYEGNKTAIKEAKECERGVMGSIYMKMARQVLKKLGRKNKKLANGEIGNQSKILERLHCDAQKLRNLQITIQDLMKKVDINEKSTKGKSVEFGEVKGHQSKLTWGEVMAGHMGRDVIEEQVWRKGPWTAEEDRLLVEYVRLHGEGRWNSVARLANKTKDKSNGDVAIDA